MMIKACQSHLLHPVRLNPNGIGISHLFFAYDSLFFLQATLQNCEHSSDLLHSYCSASGQLINVDKSNLYFSPNTPCQIINLLNSILQMRVISDLGKYLGYPQFGGDLKVLLQVILRIMFQGKCNLGNNALLANLVRKLSSRQLLLLFQHILWPASSFPFQHAGKLIPCLVTSSGATLVQMVFTGSLGIFQASLKSKVVWVLETYKILMTPCWLRKPGDFTTTQIYYMHKC